MGPYCRYCDRRCFVDDPAGGPVILATCPAGRAHDLEAGGYDIGRACAYAEALRTFAALVDAKPAAQRPTAVDYAALAAALHLGAHGEAGTPTPHAAEYLAELLAAAVLHTATAEREREQHVEELARLRAQLDVERARSEHTKERLRRRIRHAHRTRAALRTATRTGVAQ